MASYELKVQPRDFIKAWQESSTKQEVSEKLGIDIGPVASRGAMYLRKGVPLKNLPPVGQPAHNWAELAEYARSLVEEVVP